MSKSLNLESTLAIKSEHTYFTDQIFLNCVTENHWIFIDSLLTFVLWEKFNIFLSLLSLVQDIVPHKF